MSGTPLVSVVVPTRNSARTLGRLLRSLQAQSYPAIEIVVVDNDSSDDTLSIASEYADILVTRGPERSAQRNQGVALSSGEYVLILDSDMVVAPATVAACVAAAQETHAAAVVVPERTMGSGFLARCRALERRCYEGDPTIEAARFFTRHAFTSFGGYDNTLTGPEDWDLPARMKRSSEVVSRAKDALIAHDEEGVRLGAHLRKKYYYGKSFGPYVRRHPDLARTQLTPLRPAILRNWRRLAAEPVLGVGVIALKMADFAAGGLGLASATLPPRLPWHGGENPR